MAKIYEVKNGKRIIYNIKEYEKYIKFMLDPNTCVVGVGNKYDSEIKIYFGTKQKMN